MKRNVAMERN